MMEPDHILLQPLPLLATPTKSVGFAFSYMHPQESADLINSKFNPRNVSIDHFYPSGEQRAQQESREQGAASRTVRRGAYLAPST